MGGTGGTFPRQMFTRGDSVPSWVGRRKGREARKKRMCRDKTRLIRPPTPPDTPTQAPTPGTNRRNAKDKRTIPLDHPRTGPNNSLVVCDGRQHEALLAVECDRAVLVGGGKPRSLTSRRRARWWVPRSGARALGAAQRRARWMSRSGARAGCRAAALGGGHRGRSTTACF